MSLQSSKNKLAKIVGLILLFAGAVGIADNKYHKFEELVQSEQEGIDYKIESADRHSPFTVLTIHGGFIEVGTSEITKAIAAESLNYYSFEGIKAYGNWALHIASDQFDEPQAIELVSKSQACVAIHGFNDTANNTVCMGGLNSRLKKIVFRSLLETGLLQQAVDNPCGQFYASTKYNIVNRCVESGVQIEVSIALRNILRKNPQAMKLFAEKIRSAFVAYAGNEP
jgi:phage replication-related protein YjqB (UPF0714/DUF867 family)